MRFRARVGADQYQLITDVIQAMYKQGEFLCLKFTRNFLHVIVNNTGAGKSSDVVPTFAKFNAADILFFEYLVESRANNEICVECDPIQLLRASRSVKDAPEVVLKLTKKQSTARITLEATMINGVKVIQDVPVRVLKEDEFQRTNEPVMNAPEIRIMAPKDVSSIRSVVDKLKMFGKFVNITGSLNVRLQLKAQTDAVNIRTIYDGLQAKRGIAGSNTANVYNDSSSNNSSSGNGFINNNTYENSNIVNNSVGNNTNYENENKNKNESTVIVDSKQLSQALKCTTVRHDRILFCLTSDEVCVVYVAIFNKVGTLVFYLPACDRIADELE